MRKGQGDGDWEPDALELGAKLRKAQRKIKALEAENKKLRHAAKQKQSPPPPSPTRAEVAAAPSFLSPPGNSRHRRCVYVAPGPNFTHQEGGPVLPAGGLPVGVFLDPGIPLHTSPTAGATDPQARIPPFVTEGPLWVAWEASRNRFEAIETERARQEERDRTKAVRKAFGWQKGEEDPVLLRAAKGFWQGTDTQGAAGDGVVTGTRMWRTERRYRLYPGIYTPRIIFGHGPCANEHRHNVLDVFT